MKSKSVSILYFVDVDSGVYADVTNSVVCVCSIRDGFFFLLQEYGVNMLEA